MKREDKILRHIDKNGCGIEIGPSHSPIAPKKEGYNAHVIDHMGREELMGKYQGHGVPLEKIEDVDFIWHGQPYAELTGKHKYYNWIIASHMIEHTPDLIGFLNDCDTILKDDGVISLAIPDKRYCFDHFRPISGLGDIIDGHLQKNSIHTPGTIAEYYLNVAVKAGAIVWNSSTLGKYEVIHSCDDAMAKMNEARFEKSYVDVHAWCFVPHSFRLIIHDLYHLQLIPFQEVDFFPTKGCEFFITLGRKGKGIDMPRLAMLKRVDAEIRAGTYSPLKSLVNMFSLQGIRAIAKRLVNTFPSRS